MGTELSSERWCSGMTTTDDIDPNGDPVLLLKVNVTTFKLVRVDSRILRMASPVFETMLGPSVC